MLLRHLPPARVKLGSATVSLSIKTAAHVARALRDLSAAVTGATRSGDGAKAAALIEDALDLHAMAEGAIAATRREAARHNAVLKALDTGEADIDDPCVIAAAQAHAIRKLLGQHSGDLSLTTDTYEATQNFLTETRDALEEAVRIATDRLAKTPRILSRAAQAAFAFAPDLGPLADAVRHLPPDWQATLRGVPLAEITDDQFEGDEDRVKATVAQHRLRARLHRDQAEQRQKRAEASERFTQRDFRQAVRSAHAE